MPKLALRRLTGRSRNGSPWLPRVYRRVPNPNDEPRSLTIFPSRRINGVETRNHRPRRVSDAPPWRKVPPQTGNGLAPSRNLRALNRIGRAPNLNDAAKRDDVLVQRENVLPIKEIDEAQRGSDGAKRDIVPLRKEFDAPRRCINLPQSLDGCGDAEALEGATQALLAIG